MKKVKGVSSNIINKEIDIQTALGNVEGRMTQYKFGGKTVVPTTESVLWEGGSNYTFLDTASILSVVSDNANDIDGGTGARTITIYGKDTDKNDITEDIVMNGTTPVLTTQEFLRVHRVQVVQSGDGIFLPNEGTIEITAGGIEQAIILPGEGQTQMCVYTVPAGYTALITQVSYSTGRGRNVTIRLRISDDGCCFQVRAKREVFETNFNITLNPALKINEKADIVMTGASELGTEQATASFNMILIKND